VLATPLHGLKVSSDEIDLLLRRHLWQFAGRSDV